MGDGELFCYQKGVCEELPAWFCSYVPVNSFAGELIQQFLKQPGVRSPEVQGTDFDELSWGMVATAQNASLMSSSALVGTSLKLLQNLWRYQVGFAGQLCALRI